MTSSNQSNTEQTNNIYNAYYEFANTPKNKNNLSKNNFQNQKKV